MPSTQDASRRQRRWPRQDEAILDSVGAAGRVDAWPGRKNGASTEQKNASSPASRQMREARAPLASGSGAAAEALNHRARPRRSEPVRLLRV
jgi:hypothetical protein